MSIPTSQLDDPTRGAIASRLVRPDWPPLRTRFDPKRSRLFDVQLAELDGCRERLFGDLVRVRKQVLVGKPQLDAVGEREPLLFAHRIHDVDQIVDATLAQQ